MKKKIVDRGLGLLPRSTFSCSTSIGFLLILVLFTIEGANFGFTDYSHRQFDQLKSIEDFRRDGRVHSWKQSFWHNKDVVIHKYPPGNMIIILTLLSNQTTTNLLLMVGAYVTVRSLYNPKKLLPRMC